MCQLGKYAKTAMYYFTFLCNINCKQWTFIAQFLCYCKCLSVKLSLLISFVFLILLLLDYGIVCSVLYLIFFTLPLLDSYLQSIYGNHLSLWNISSPLLRFIFIVFWLEFWCSLMHSSDDYTLRKWLNKRRFPTISILRSFFLCPLVPEEKISFGNFNYFLDKIILEGEKNDKYIQWININGHCICWHGNQL